MLFFLYVSLVWCTRGSEAVVKLPPNVTIPALIVFGDSIGDQGCNNNLTTLVKCNFSPYGKDFIGGLATGRFSNGKTPPDMIGIYIYIYFSPSYKYIISVISHIIIS